MPANLQNLRSWPKGVSGNPKGRPKGLMEAVRRRAGRDGKKLVEGLWLIAYGTPDQRHAHFGEVVKVSAKERLTAIDSLLDRGFGRPAQLNVVSNDPGLLQPPAIHNHFTRADDTSVA